MNLRRSRDRDKSSWHQRNNRIARSQNQVKQIRRSSDNYQITRSRQLLRFWLQRYGCSYFSRGLAWGIIVSLTAVFSAMGGGALTKIDAVEQAIANFVGELESNSIEVDLPSPYVPGKTLASKRSRQSTSTQPQPIPSEAETVSKYSRGDSVAVQNTTNNPELGMRVVAYLRQQNFRDVYLVEHLPLKLDRTRIVAPHTQVATANYIQQVLGFGNLKATDLQQRLTLQIGKDARYLPLNY